MFGLSLLRRGKNGDNTLQGSTMKKLYVTIFFLFLVSIATAETWVTNRDHSEIMFQVPYMGVSELTGRFNEFNGKVEFTDQNDRIESLLVQISASTIDTGNKMRDGHLKGGDFFQCQQHPYITFKSNQISSIGANTYKASGDMSIKGITRPASILFTATKSLKDTWGYENKFIKFKSSINRKDYNINWNKTLDGKQFLVGDVVTFWGTFQIQPAKSATPNSKHMIPDTQYIRNRDMERRNGTEQLEKESTISRKLREIINGN